MSNYGIRTTQNDQDVSSNNFSYDTTKKHLLVDLTQPQKQLAVLDNFVPGTALQLTGIVDDYKEEILLTIPHNNGFKPTPLSYYFIKSISGDPTQGGGYSQNIYFFSGSAGTFQDIITLRTWPDRSEFVHLVQDFSSGTIWSSPAPSFLMRIKYFIFSNPIDRVL